MRVLIVEDDPVHAKAAARVIEPLGHEVVEARDGEMAQRLLDAELFDLVILDWLLPRMSGFEVLYWIRRALGTSPAVLFLTSKTLDDDIMLALDAGADDYIVKPFRVGELASRVNALLMRSKRATDRFGLVDVGDYMLNLRDRTILLRGEPVKLAPKEFDLAELFFSNIGKLLSRKVVCISTWGRELDPASRTLDTHIYRIRQKLELGPENGLRLSSVYTHGYRLEAVSSVRLDGSASAHRPLVQPLSVLPLLSTGLTCE
ncbi:response regulator transcription factor [Paraburkholderia fynbosensis]|uniref:Sensory transduction protein regX3 n=1 Tax=Paraburkholderia fynbosensis TaxID=1200993 RepID=A0A6J5H3E0_9BURK|nr:response regulator transcription factor [Paraburkholderia fynbosensis]CAB3810913.1 Sensory transduction protein regX3 [Paraburkholderia fynbosensis]